MSTLSKKVYEYANNKLGQKVGSGECFDLADFALRSIDAKTAKDYGKITDNADYVWGELINFMKAVSGDIIQFRNYKATITVNEDGYTPYKSQYTFTRPHHTAVVSRIKGNGVILVLEQNIGDGPQRRTVQENELYFGSPAPTQKGKEKTIITVSGIAKFYRPQKADAK